MTPERASADMLARWDHEPVDQRDVDERIAIRLVDLETPPVVRTVELAPVVRVFVQHGDRWRSCYVHSAWEVDEALDSLLCAS